ncbi:MAG: RluA family pseudouridine synthase [Treponema sp.]|jgi:23S rRNA pseudouridine955/2504/2580 synthase|nr:RluA family pseudouridine synthase [Treponema sp.]
MKRIEVLFENEFCLVLNKPAGLAVQGGEGVGLSLDRILEAEYRPRPLLVHRLDKDTSGVILTAKGPEAAARFSAVFAGPGGAKKQYLAVCAGLPRPAEGIIRLDLEVRGRAGVRKKSETRYRLAASSPDGEFSLLELELGTGRTHQIRRHLAGIGHPILGDDKYGDFALNKTLRKTRGLRRLLLHCVRLCIGEGRAGFPGGVDVRAPPPSYFGSFGIDMDCPFSHDDFPYGSSSPGPALS